MGKRRAASSRVRAALDYVFVALYHLATRTPLATSHGIMLGALKYKSVVRSYLNWHARGSRLLSKGLYKVTKAVKYSGVSCVMRCVHSGGSGCILLCMKLKKVYEITFHIVFLY